MSEIPNTYTTSDNDELQKYLCAYKEAFEVERNKSAIYANLFTIMITCIGGIYGIYFSNMEKNELVLAVIPFFSVIWGAFVLFNVAYLKLIRTYLRKLENILFLNMNNVQWFSIVFQEGISKKYFGFSYPLVIIVCVMMALIVLHSGAVTLISQPKWFAIPYAILFISSLGIGAWFAFLFYRHKKLLEDDSIL